MIHANLNHHPKNLGAHHRGCYMKPPIFNFAGLLLGGFRVSTKYVGFLKAGPFGVDSDTLGTSCCEVDLYRKEQWFNC